MANEEDLSHKKMQEILSELTEPIVFKNILGNNKKYNWKLIDWSFEDLANTFGDLKLPFRVGNNTRTIHPQWEVETPIEYKTMKEFMSDITLNINNSKWFYFDYKHMSEWFKDKPDILKSINWDQFELNLEGIDSTIWIGSKGAHTVCHQDTYGCNLVAQTHGSKLWLLFSPTCSSSMQPTRIPYEESTIYSKYNFFTPGLNEIQAIKTMIGKVKMITLQPKDVLFIPRGWWHYVESLETSISVNVWLPLKEDCNARLTETLVHLVMNTLGKTIPKTVNQLESNLTECLKFVDVSLIECQEINKCTDPLQKQRKLNSNETISFQTLNIKYPNCIELVPDFTLNNMSDFLTKNDFGNCQNIVSTLPNTTNFLSNSNLLDTVVDAFCHPDIVLKISQIIKEKLVEKQMKNMN